MIAQISRTAPTTPDDRAPSGRIPPYIYPDSENRDRAIIFTITCYTRTEVWLYRILYANVHGKHLGAV